MDGINLGENDVRDPDLMTAIAAGDRSTGNISISHHHPKNRAHLACFLTNTQGHIYLNLAPEREFRPYKRSGFENEVFHRRL